MGKCLLFPGNVAFSVPILEILLECNKSDCVYVEEMKHITVWGGMQGCDFLWLVSTLGWVRLIPVLEQACWRVELGPIIF